MKLEPTILYEDKDMLAISKPAGLVVHSDDKTEEITLVDWVLKKYPDLKEVGGNFELPSGTVFPRAGIAHRLDRDTSGVMLIAKNQETFDFLREQFSTYKIKKVYHGIVWGVIKEDIGTIERKIGRAKNGVMWTTANQAKGNSLRDAITKFRVLGRSKRFSLVEFYPLTGRTHQIRVHMKSIHRPLVSDMLYGNGVNEGKALGIDRTALHAQAVSFLLPNGKDMKLTAPYPEDFQKAIDNMKTEDAL